MLPVDNCPRVGINIVISKVTSPDVWVMSIRTNVLPVSRRHSTEQSRSSNYVINQTTTYSKSGGYRRYNYYRNCVVRVGGVLHL